MRVNRISGVIWVYGHYFICLFVAMAGSGLNLHCSTFSDDYQEEDKPDWSAQKLLCLGTAGFVGVAAILKAITVSPF